MSEAVQITEIVFSLVLIFVLLPACGLIAYTAWKCRSAVLKLFAVVEGVNDGSEESLSRLRELSDANARESSRLAVSYAQELKTMTADVEKRLRDVGGLIEKADSGLSTRQKELAATLDRIESVLKPLNGLDETLKAVLSVQQGQVQLQKDQILSLEAMAGAVAEFTKLVFKKAPPEPGFEGQSDAAEIAASEGKVTDDDVRAIMTAGRSGGTV